MQDRSGKEVNIHDIVYAVDGLSMVRYLVVSEGQPRGTINCQAVDENLEIIPQPKKCKFKQLKLVDCFLHSKLVNDKYIKAL